MRNWLSRENKSLQATLHFLVVDDDRLMDVVVLLEKNI